MDPGVLENPGLLWGSVWEQEGSKPVGPMVISLPKRLSRRAAKGEQNLDREESHPLGDTWLERRGLVMLPDEAT